jgi:L-fucose isomerase-like protein
MRKQRSSLREGEDGPEERNAFSGGASSQGLYEIGAQILREKRISLGVEEVNLLEIVK